MLYTRYILAFITLILTSQSDGFHFNRRDAFVTTPEGRLKGFVRDGVFHFVGIRYGQAPVGERR